MGISTTAPGNTGQIHSTCIIPDITQNMSFDHIVVKSVALGLTSGDCGLTVLEDSGQRITHGYSAIGSEDQDDEEGNKLGANRLQAHHPVNNGTKEHGEKHLDE